MFAFALPVVVLVILVSCLLCTVSFVVLSSLSLLSVEFVLPFVGDIGCALLLKIHPKRDL